MLVSVSVRVRVHVHVRVRVRVCVRGSESPPVYPQMLTASPPRCLAGSLPLRGILRVEKCKLMSSVQRPLWLCFAPARADKSHVVAAMASEGRPSHSPITTSM